MSLTQIREDWNRAAREDAMFNILTTAGRENGSWDHEEFFATGRVEIDGAMTRLSELGLSPRNVNRALDFGCGVGRLTQALAHHYVTAYGVDLSREMVRQARALCDRSDCEFFTNSKPNLRLFGETRFDFIYSVITLQHMPPGLQRGYVSEFIRLLAPEGLAMFQTTEGTGASAQAHYNAWLSMYGVHPDTVKEWVSEAGGEVLNAEETHHSGAGWRGWQFVVRRAA